MEKAPSALARTSLRASATLAPRSTARASSSATRSESDSIEVTAMPASSASATVLVRFPLCAMAKTAPSAERKTGCAAVQFAEPEVE